MRRRPHRERDVVSYLLNNGGLIIGFNPDAAAFVRSFQVLDFFDALMNNKSDRKMTSLFADFNINSLEEQHLATLTNEFVPPAALTGRLDQLKERLQNIKARTDEAFQKQKLFPSILIVLGMVTGIISLGKLINYRICTAKSGLQQGNWNDVDTSGLRSQLVVQTIVLLWIFNAIDLSCTIAANNSGGFWELNPLARSMLTESASLATFKISAVVLGTGLLLYLRRYRGAEVASWWTCFTYTILTFRWVVYNSLFM